MSKITFPAGTMLAPLPAVMVSCGTMEQPNIITVAWTGIVCSDPAMTYVSVRKERFSHDIIRDTGEFVINLPHRSLARYTDLCGVISGRKVSKFSYCNLTKSKSYKVSAPYIAECPISIECKVRTVTELGSHDMFLADIVNVIVDSSLVSDTGKIMYEKADLIVYSHGEYFALGDSVGKFGFSVKKK